MPSDLLIRELLKYICFIIKRYKNIKKLDQNFTSIIAKKTEFLSQAEHFLG